MYVLKLNNIDTHMNQYEELVKLFLNPADFKIVTGTDNVSESEILEDAGTSAHGAGSSEPAVQNIVREFDFNGDKNKIKREIYHYLSEVTGEKPKWGILTGIRPVKLAGELYESMKAEFASNGHSADGASSVRAAVKQHLQTEYLISDEKSNLILDMYEYQQEHLGKPPANSAGIYIGIPFCPTRCLYCSFTSNQVSCDKYEGYLEALFKEISFVGEGMKRDGITVESIYIGGGTPTSLNDDQLDRLLSHIKDSFDLSSSKEFTVEAGRPDTFTPEKLEVLKKHGVERISINPQTMHDETLVTIGRDHTVQQTRDAFKMAYGCGIPVVNADLIAGLPDEDVDDFLESLKEVMEFGPENITLHTLAVKRSSRLKEMDENFHYKQPRLTEEMLVKAKEILTAAGYRPYYLYRQKHTAGSTENIGYCKNDTLSLYNVRIMEEAQSIIALGAGGITKVYYPEENRLERVPNVSNYEIYIERIEEMLDRKAKNLFQEVTLC